MYLCTYVFNLLIYIIFHSQTRHCCPEGYLISKISIPHHQLRRVYYYYLGYYRKKRWKKFSYCQFFPHTKKQRVKEGSEIFLCDCSSCSFLTQQIQSYNTQCGDIATKLACITSVCYVAVWNSSLFIEWMAKRRGICEFCTALMLGALTQEKKVRWKFRVSVKGKKSAYNCELYKVITHTVMYEWKK